MTETKALRASKSKNGYASAADCPWMAFENAIVDADLSAFASEEQFHFIYSEYLDALSGGKTTAMDRQLESQNRLASRIFRLSQVMSLLRELWHPGLVEILRKDFPRYKFEFPDDSYYLDLDRVDGHLKSDKLRLEGMQADASKKVHNNKPVTHLYFTEVFQHISAFNKYAVRKTETSVEDYCVHVRRMQEHNDAVRKQTESIKNNGRSVNK